MRAQRTRQLAPAAALKKELLGVALSSQHFRAAIVEAADEIRGEARQGVTEATIEGCFERVLYVLLRDTLGLKIHPKKEVRVDVRRHTATGRLDSRIGAVIIEYKRPALLKTAAQIESAQKQLEEYLVAVSAESDGAPLVGLLTDGLVLIEIRATRGEVSSRSTPERLNADALGRVARLFAALELTALTAENLIKDFCGSQTDGVLFRIARTLDNILVASPQPKTSMLRQEWEALFRLSHDDLSQQRRIEDRQGALAELFGLPVSDASTEYRVLFALQTAYAIVLKLIAYRVVSDVYLGKPDTDFKGLQRAPKFSRNFCEALEDGGIFRALGILNLLEGDFFSWYVDKRQWTPALGQAMEEALSILARYEEAPSVFSSEKANDLFRELYQATMPQAVRSSLGEFYTPYWLAEHVLDSAIQGAPAAWRAIDPCCGSGTFLIAAISRIRREVQAPPKVLLREILERVAGIDLNPLSVLTARIHFFVHVSDLLQKDSPTALVIPIYLGDAASTPDVITLDGIDCLRYKLRTLKAPVDSILPLSAMRDTAALISAMVDYERCVKNQDAGGGRAVLLELIPKRERRPIVITALDQMTATLITLQSSGWNGIWARILSNFLAAGCLGQFSAIVGNPPWIDWKNLPAGYRERIKGLCIDRGLFSGAGRTGGINLNICALIAYTSLTNWLDRAGRMAFLMPRELINQPSYEGWRRLGGKGWGFARFVDWTEAGHPFDPVKEDFLTYVISAEPAKRKAVPITTLRKKAGDPSRASTWGSADEALLHLDISSKVAGQIIPGSTQFTVADTPTELDAFRLVAGECEYIGREGIEFYPQELLLFKYDSPGPKTGTVWLRNIQVQKSKYKIPPRRVLLETRYLHPLVKGPGIKPFTYEYDGFIVAFPYEPSDPARPISANRLRFLSPLLWKFYEDSRGLLEGQTAYSNKIRGPNPGEFYGLARTGPYSFAPIYVAFRDNTKWNASVVSDADMPWGGRRRFVFQNHAVSMCERKGGAFVQADEAHFICSILNAPIVRRFILASSDERSFKIRPPVFLPVFDSSNKWHQALSEASKSAHAILPADTQRELEQRIEGLYLDLCRERAAVSAGPASKPLSLHPLAPEDALRLAMNTPPDEGNKERLSVADQDAAIGRTLGPFGSAKEAIAAMKKRGRAGNDN